MKLSPDTLQILKNFSSINQSLLFKQGSILRTISEGSSTIAIAGISEDIPSDFVIYDLNEFLGVVSLFDDPNLNLKDKYLDIKEEKGRSSVKYYFGDESMITVPPQDLTKINKVISSAEIRFSLTEEQFAKLQKGYSTLGLPNLTVQSDGSEILMVATDVANPTSHNYSVELGDGNGDSFMMVFKTENLKLLKGSYDVSISSKGASYFKNTEIPLEYYISLEQSSTYGG